MDTVNGAQSGGQGSQMTAEDWLLFEDGVETFLNMLAERNLSAYLQLAR